MNENGNYEINVKVCIDAEDETLSFIVNDRTYIVGAKNGVLTYDGNENPTVPLTLLLNRMGVRVKGNEFTTGIYQKIGSNFKKILNENLKETCNTKKNRSFDFELEGLNYDFRTVSQILNDNESQN